METVPPWMVIVSICLLVLSAFLLLLPLFDRRNRAMLLLGIRYSGERNLESIGMALPIAMLISIVLSSLSVGDGLYLMVEENTDRNLSDVDIVIEAPGFLRTDILPVESGMKISPVIKMDGILRGSQGPSSGVTIIGMDERFIELGDLEEIDGTPVTTTPDRFEIMINEKLAREISCERGDSVILTFDPTTRREDVLLSSRESGRIVLNLTLTGIVSNAGLGRYREDALDDIEPLAFLSLELLQERLEVLGKANRFLMDTSSEMDPSHIKELLEGELSLDDAGLEVLEAESAGGYILRSDDFFFDDTQVDPAGRGISTMSYFVDSISTGSGSLSYSVISGMDIFLGTEERRIKPGEMVVNEWTAEVLDLSVGDTVTMGYRTLTGYGIKESSEKSFNIAEIVPIQGTFAEREFIPPIRGITSEISCSDWAPEFEIDLDSLKEEDLSYWENFTTTPKAFISLEDARDIWATPWGNTTAIWYPEQTLQSQQDIQRDLSLGSVEITVIEVRQNALSSSRALTIFPGMFLTFGMAVILSAAMILSAVIREITLRRVRDWGMLRSMGTGRSGIFLFGLYGSLRSIMIGTLGGIFLGYLISAFIGWGLDSIWSDAVEGSSVPLRISTDSIIVSVSAGIIISLMVIV